MKRIRAIAMIVFGVIIIMPFLSRANFAETFSQKAAFTGFALGSTLDQSIDAVKDVASSMYQVAGEEIKRQHSMLMQAKNQIERQHSMLMQAKNHLMSRGHQMLRSLPRMLGATKQSALALVSSLRPSHNPSQSPLVKGRKSEISPPYQGGALRGSEDQQTLAQAKDEDGKSLPRLAERIIERIIIHEGLGNRVQGLVNNIPSSLNPNPSTLNPSQDPRINTLITNMADLTSRVDERYGVSANLGGAYSNSALFNMIAQSQRIKTLDDVKITNATIEGYAQSSSLSSYLPLTGGTLTGGLTGTSLTLSGTLSLSNGTLNASSTAHITGRFSLGENLTFSATSATTTIPSSLRNAFAFATTSASTPFLTFDTSNYRVGIGTTSPGRTFSVKGDLLANALRLYGTGTSTIAGRLEITASSTVGGYRICTQQNNVCPSPWSSSGGLTTLSTATDLVGLGTSTPSEKLSVNGGVYFDSDIIRFGSSSAPTLNFRYFTSSTSTIPNLTSAFTFATSTTNTNPLFTLSTKSSRYGLVGIGTSSPSALLAIEALNATGVPRNFFYVGSSTQNTFVIDNHGNIGIGTSSPRSLLTIEGGLGAYFTSSGLLGLGTTTPWKSSTLSIEQNGVNPLFAVGDTGTTTPFFFISPKGVISLGSTSPVLTSASDLVIGRNGVTNDAYISGGLGIGNATTTDGILETLGLGYIGGVLKVKGTGTSTFSGGIQMLGGCVRTLGGNCLKEVVTVRKTADETVNNSTTLQDDDALFLAMAANETWFFTLSPGYVSSTIADFKVAITIPTGATMRFGCAGGGADAGGNFRLCDSNSTSGQGETWAGDGTNRHFILTGIVINGSTAGNLQFQWAQNTAEASDTKVLANSYLEAHK